MASKPVLRVVRAATRFVLNNSREMGAKMGTLAIAAGVAGVAFHQSAASPGEVGFALDTLKVAGGMTTAAVASYGFGKILRDPLRTLDNWAKNEPLSILIKAGQKGAKNPAAGEKYLAGKLDSMGLKDRQRFHEFTVKQQRLSTHKDIRFDQYRPEISRGMQSYKRIKMGLEPAKHAVPENKASRHRVGDVYIGPK